VKYFGTKSVDLIFSCNLPSVLMYFSFWKKIVAWMNYMTSLLITGLAVNGQNRRVVVAMVTMAPTRNLID
jgi:hypothetical protein